MAYNPSFLVLRGKWGVIFLSGLLCAALAFLLLVFSSKSFKADTDFLVVQNQPSGSNQDFYSLFKSTEYLGKVLSESIFSERFIEAVIATGKVDANTLPADKKNRLETWGKRVSVQQNVEAGIIKIQVMDNDQRTVLKTSQAIQDVLTQQNMLFRGGEEKSVEIRVLSGPIVERNPSVKKIAVVAMAGFLLGASLLTSRLLMRGQSRDEWADVYAPASGGRLEPALLKMDQVL